MSVHDPSDHANGTRAVLLALAESLNNVRDVLVECSLMLHDAHFDLEEEQRGAAAECLKSAMGKITAR